VDAALPERWITRVVVDPQDETVSFVTVSGFRWDEFSLHIFRSTDFGASWANVSGNLPEAPVNDVAVDPMDTSVLYAATDFGVWVSTNLGASWSVLGEGLPNTVVSDLELHAPSHLLIAATYGRSMWKYDLDQGTAVIAGQPATSALPAPHLAELAPNPSRGRSVAVEFSLPRSAVVSLSVHDVLGRLVAKLAEGSFEGGSHQVAWSQSVDGVPPPPGTYFVRLIAEGVVRTRKITVVH
jgi:hypothetical protein